MFRSDRDDSLTVPPSPVVPLAMKFRLDKLFPFTVMVPACDGSVLLTLKRCPNPEIVPLGDSTSMFPEFATNPVGPAKLTPPVPALMIVMLPPPPLADI